MAAVASKREPTEASVDFAEDLQPIRIVDKAVLAAVAQECRFGSWALAGRLGSAFRCDTQHTAS
jgi:hypothetical protein